MQTQYSRAPVNPELVSWARKRAGYSLEELTKKFKKLPDWESGLTQPTMNQIEDFARKVHVPLGYLFCSEPPEEAIPIPDFRTFSGDKVTRPSPNLLDTLCACLRRQHWYQEFALVEQLPEFDFIGSVTISTPPESVAVQIAETINFDTNARQACSTWVDALRYFIKQVDEVGILVMVSGIVGSNTRRLLNPEEFRGFALSDPYAPLIFINGADTKAAQIFTLAHELAHLWLGDSALSNSGILINQEYPREEIWCNAVAAELLVPLAHLKSQTRENEFIPSALSRLAKLYKVSTLVILRRLLDANYLTHDEFRHEWNVELTKLLEVDLQSGKGGDFYRSTISRVGRRFAYAIVTNAYAGKTLSRDAFRLLGISRNDTFEKLAHELGVSR